jgi:hypothetical protein
MSLPHFSEESGSPYFLRKQHHKRVEGGYLSTLTHKVTPAQLASISPPRIARSLVFLTFPAMHRWIVKYFLQARSL